MGRKPCCSKEGLNRGAWTAMEDEILVSYINKHGEGKWGSLPKRAGLNRCGKSCRLRWLNYLRPGIKRGNISDDEEELIVRLHRLLGNRWSLIAGRLPGRTDNEIKNYWNTSLGKRVLLQQGENISCWNKAIAPPPKGAAPKPQASSDAAGAGDGAPEAMPDTSPIRTKALRCTRVLAGHDPPPEMAAADDDHQVQEPAVDEAVGQQDFGGDHLSIGSVDLDFDGIELGFLSPWHDGAAGSVGDHQFGTCASGTDLEELLGAGGHDDGVPSLADLELPWL